MTSSVEEYNKSSNNPNANNNDDDFTKIEITPNNTKNLLKNLTYEDYQNNNNNNINSSSNYSLGKGIYSCIRRRAYIFPLFFSIWIPLICIVPYTSAVLLGHVNAIFPYVSDTGASSPQAGFWSMMMDVAALVGFASGLFRYKMIKYELNNQVQKSLKLSKNDDVYEEHLKHYHFLNYAAFILVCISSLGIIMVGNYRANELTILHVIGALLCFVPMSIYYFFQLKLVYFLYKHNAESCPASLIVFIFIGGIGLFTATVFTALSIIAGGVHNVSNDNWRFHWSSHQPGYVYHCLGSAGEWIAIFSLSPVFFSFFNRMKKFEHLHRI